MSITLATYLQELQPDWNIQIYERLDERVMAAMASVRTLGWAPDPATTPW